VQKGEEEIQTRVGRDLRTHWMSLGPGEKALATISGFYKKVPIIERKRKMLCKIRNEFSSQKSSK
jgi:hypothetical protein